MTFEEVKRIRENPTYQTVLDMEELSDKIDEAINKQIPYPTGDKFIGTCKCGKKVYPHQIYCNQCGQKLDWGDEK